MASKDRKEKIMNIKKIISIVMVVMMLCALVSCDKDKTTETPTTAPTEAPTTAPTEAPTAAPTEAPTTAPTEAPTSSLTEAPTSASTEAPTTAPTEEKTVEEIVEEILLTADQKLADSIYFVVDVATTGSFSDSMSGTTENSYSYEKAIFAGSNFKSESVDSDEYEMYYTLVDGVLYNKMGSEGEFTKTKMVFDQEEQKFFLDEIRSSFMYEDGIEYFTDIAITKQGDGGMICTLSGITDEGREEMMGLIDDVILEFTVDAEGNYKSLSLSTYVRTEVLGTVVEGATVTSYTYTYYEEGELEITVPEDADEYELVESGDVEADPDTEEAEALFETAQKYHEQNNVTLNGEIQYTYSDGSVEKETFIIKADGENAFISSVTETYEYLDMLYDNVYYESVVEISGYGDDVSKYKYTVEEFYHDAEYLSLIGDFNVAWMYSDIEITYADDGSATIVLKNQYDFVSEMLTVKIDANGRYESIDESYVMYGEDGETVEYSSARNTVFDYESEVTITPPADADEYEEYVEEEWSCDCGAESWYDCICEYEWSCDCGADNWFDCICE